MLKEFYVAREQNKGRYQAANQAFVAYRKKNNLPVLDQKMTEPPEEVKRFLRSLKISGFQACALHALSQQTGSLEELKSALYEAGFKHIWEKLAPAVPTTLEK